MATGAAPLGAFTAPELGRKRRVARGTVCVGAAFRPGGRDPSGPFGSPGKGGFTARRVIIERGRETIVPWAGHGRLGWKSPFHWDSAFLEKDLNCGKMGAPPFPLKCSHDCTMG